MRQLFQVQGHNIIIYPPTEMQMINRIFYFRFIFVFHNYNSFLSQPFFATQFHVKDNNILLFVYFSDCFPIIIYSTLQ